MPPDEPSWMAGAMYQGSPKGNLGNEGDKWDFRRKLLRDPKERDVLFRYTKAEVGGQGSQAKQAFMESVANRADAEKKTISELIGGQGGKGSKYYPQITHSRAGTQLSEREKEEYAGIGGQVEGGSNICNYCTGNASGKVGFAGGPQTAGYQGEKYGIEGWTGKWATSKGYTGSVAQTEGTSDQEWEHRAGMQAEREGQGGDKKPLENKDTDFGFKGTNISGPGNIEGANISLPGASIDQSIQAQQTIRGRGATRATPKGRYFSEM